MKRLTHAFGILVRKGLCGLITLSLASCCQLGPQDHDVEISPLLDRLTATKLASVNMEGAQIEDAVLFLEEQSEEGAPTSEERCSNRNLIVASHTFSERPALITFSATDISQICALKVSCLLAGVEYRIEDKWVIVGEECHAPRVTISTDCRNMHALSVAVISQVDTRKATVKEFCEYYFSDRNSSWLWPPYVEHPVVESLQIEIEQDCETMLVDDFVALDLSVLDLISLLTQVSPVRCILDGDKLTVSRAR